MKRICLFAGYNYNNIISEYVVDYLRELSQYCDIYYLTDGFLDTEKLSLLRPFVKDAWVENHHKYDFGSWSLLANKYVGWDKIEKYDELIFANDSCFCVNPFKPVFEKMDKQSDLDMWGLAAADNSNTTEFSSFDKYIKKNCDEFYVGSYFLAFRKSMFKKQSFQDFINNINVTNNRKQISVLYEFEILKYAIRNKMKIGVFDENVWRYSSVYMRDAFNMIKSGFPLLKVRIFVDNIGGATLMPELAVVTESFVKYPYMKYVKQIQSERHCNKNTNHKLYDTKQKLKYWVLPPILTEMLHTSKYKPKKILFFLRKILQCCIPPFVRDFEYSIFHMPKSINKTNKIVLSLRRPPLYHGFCPEHIKGYKKTQYKLAQKYKDSKNMVVFFNVMRECISGGMLSIDRFVQHSLPFAKSGNFDLVLSGIPLNNAVIKNPFFNYAMDPVDFNYLVKYTHPDKLLLNIPECFVPYFCNEISEQAYKWLFSIRDLRINILNQNDDLMPSQNTIEELRTLCNNKLTITAAHKRYATKEKSKQYKCPVHLLTPFLPEFIRTPFENKEKIIVLSPDEHEYRQTLINLIKKELPDYEIRIVENMTLDEYKKLISRAMFTITFGEGYDGYFLEPYLSDSIGFCVLNPTFFPKEFKPLETTYESWNVLLNHIVKDIRKYESDAKLYKNISDKGEKEIRRFTNNKESDKDLNAFYDRFLHNA